MHDVAVIGAGIAGMATAARLQARGLSTIVFEAHGQPGGCAGFFRKTDSGADVIAAILCATGLAQPDNGSAPLEWSQPSSQSKGD